MNKEPWLSGVLWRRDFARVGSAMAGVQRFPPPT
jgi:hypothetical protein